MFSDDVWQRTAELMRAIHEHPFIQALGDGSLDPGRFGFYIVQDARYLEAFSRALATASARASDPADAAFWAQSAHTALAAERMLHAGYVEELGAGDLATSPTCLAYASYLQATALTAPYPVIAAAVLPCFWIYQDVGTALLKRAGGTEGHPYGRWISTYSDPGFAASVERAKGIADRLAGAAGPDTRAAMARAYCRAAAYEWMFWDSAWRRESWPTEGWLAP
ncbi:thiaminase II [Nonomuraea sp. MG754425]|uniref:TenA family protein n=1 Tax=Nonomuraea sp. MG754425 TaxID=2570319 RepID=UPI001F209D71|nr:TenA family protein [Nonomuraea sp. MG754425]MCF6468837.1 thiaminase II [Nonomuraea sp. MG754425]